MTSTRVFLYDTTLRDGAQQEGISLSVEDKLKITQKLDELGIHFIEGGWPGSNPKDSEFFRRVHGLRLKQATLAAFGSTRRPHITAETDDNLQALAQAGVPVVTLVGKSWDSQVTQVLETSLEENRAMISDSVAFLKAQGLRVFFDAEHFFDGFKANAQYALACLEAAARGGAEWLVLCDTNGGSLPQDIISGIEAAKKTASIPLGIHAHNDGELAVANSLAAILAGATQVQGTINGYGERCGNANLCSIIPSLQLKLGLPCLSPKKLSTLTEVSRYVSEIANLTPTSQLPYVGTSAFAHKAGLHVSGLSKWSQSYQHIDPVKVGNRNRVLISEISGRSNIQYKAKEKGLQIGREEAAQVLDRIKALESRGFQFDGAEASFELLIHRARPGYRPPFELVDFMVIVEKRRRLPQAGDEETLSEAMVKVRVGEEVVHTAAEGNGPVNALDLALRRALLGFYPSLEVLKLVDYKVRILEESAGTEAQVRVLIESSDGHEEWHTVGASTNIIEASWQALVDSIEYWLWKRGITR